MGREECGYSSLSCFIISQMKMQFLEMRNITKDFPGVRALDSISISLGQGEVHALVGENGAGKSTLIKILSGAYKSDQGEIWLDGEKKDYDSPVQALNLGIGAIYQEFNLAPNLSVAQNVMLGQVPNRYGVINTKEVHKQTEEVFDLLGVNLDTHELVGKLSVAQQQIVEIAKALARNLRIIIMDEPTAALTSIEIQHLFEVIRTLKDQAVSTIYISHRLGEIFEIADTVSVLKDGKLVGTRSINEVNRDEVVRMMIGRELKDYYPPKDTIAEGSVLKVRDLSVHNKLYSINLEIRKGEILGVAGLEGQGQNELIRAIIGEIKRDVGEIYRNGENVKIESAIDAIRAGIGYIPDDRKQDGLILIRSVNENIALPSLKKRIQNLIFINNKKEKTFVNGLIEKLAIIITSRLQLVRNLSGGNQQKVVLAKWLGIKPEVLVVAEPTRGIDVGSKSEIHHMMRDLARQGVGILMVSSELPEILGMSDRIIVMAEGRIVAEMPWQQASEEVIMAAATKDIISEEISADAFSRL